MAKQSYPASPYRWSASGIDDSLPCLNVLKHLLELPGATLTPGCFDLTGAQGLPRLV
jgi:hypothetical protein